MPKQIQNRMVSSPGIYVFLDCFSARGRVKEKNERFESRHFEVFPMKNKHK